jgi:hypothetical protein
MKKQLQKQLVELAQEITGNLEPLKIGKMKEEARQLYEKLSVLEYLESQIEGTETLKKQEESLDSKSFREQNWFKDPSPLPEPEIKEEIIEPATEKIKDIVAQMPKEADDMDDFLNQVIPPQKARLDDWEELAAHYQETPVFERKDNKASQISSVISEVVEETPSASESDRPKSINDTLSGGLTIGLNDRLAFIKHLFSGNADDFTRVLSQINTMQNFAEVRSFMEGQIKPDYNHWQDKDEFAERFMTLLEKRFN